MPHTCFKFSPTRRSFYVPQHFSCSQLASGWFGAILFSITIIFASITPKVVSGYSLKDLLEAATTDKMQGEGLQKVGAVRRRIGVAELGGQLFFQRVLWTCWRRQPATD